MSINEVAQWLGHAGEVLVLFETPSGFALFNYNAINLYSPESIENIWSDFAFDYVAHEVIRLKDFQYFVNKANAISLQKGVNNQLRWMIKKSLRRGQKLAVGKIEYKQIIEEQMGVHCLFDEAVMELMWGLQNLMKSLVPEERVELTEEDRLLHISKGMKIFLGRYGFDLRYKPHMRYKNVIQAAYALYQCNCCEQHHEESLKQCAKILKEISGINTEDWSCLKVASALKVVCYPKEFFEYDEILSDAEVLKLIAEAPKFEGKLLKSKCRAVYNAIVRASIVRLAAMRDLEYYLPKLLSEGDSQAGSELQVGRGSGNELQVGSGIGSEPQADTKILLKGEEDQGQGGPPTSPRGHLARSLSSPSSSSVRTTRRSTQM